MSTSTITPTPSMFAGKRPNQLAAPTTVLDPRCGATHPNGATCSRTVKRCNGRHIDFRANVSWTTETLAARGRLETGTSTPDADDVELVMAACFGDES